MALLSIKESIDILKAAGYKVYRHVASNKWFIETDNVMKSVYTLGLIQTAQFIEDYLVEKLF